MSTRAHTVPAFYLQGFVSPESETDRSPYVWLGSIESGHIAKRAPQNISIARGLYDGQGGFDDPALTMERHLSRVESAAAVALRGPETRSGRAAPASARPRFFLILTDVHCKEPVHPQTQPMFATLTSKGQITLPKEIRDRLRLDAGATLDFQLLPDNTITARQVKPDARRVRGLLKSPHAGALSVEEMDRGIERHLQGKHAMVKAAAAKGRKARGR